MRQPVRPTSVAAWLALLALALGGALWVPACAAAGAQPEQTGVRGRTAPLAVTPHGTAPSPDASTPPVAAAADGSSTGFDPVNASAPLVIEIWHDFSCPWCRIGVTNLESALASLPEQRVEIVFHPFLLDPTTPPEGRDLRRHLGERYGHERVAGMFDRVTEVGAGYGITFRFDNITSSPATAATHAALAATPPELQRAFVHALHAAYFERGQNIGLPEVIAACAQEAGVASEVVAAAATDPAALARVQQAAGEAYAMGIRSVPQIVIGDQALPGGQPPAVFAQAIADALAP